MFTKLFWKDASERVVSTLAQAALPFVAADGFDLWHVNWHLAVTVIGGAGVLSLVKALAAGKKAGTLSPASLVKANNAL